MRKEKRGNNVAIISSGITTLTDLNDAIISGTQPVNPTAGTLWIDSSKSPAVLKIYKNGAWATQDLDLNSLDPNMAESIRNVVATIGNMSNDNLLDYKERQIIKDDLTEILGKVLLDTETVLPTVAQLEVLAKGSFYSTRRNALNAGIETSNSIYTDVATQYQNLKTYLESLTPIKPWNVAVADKDKNVTVIKNTFRDKWLQYYLATEKLNLTTTEKIKEAQDNLDGKISEVSLRDKTEILSGNPVFTDKSDDAVVHVGVDGRSVQNAGSGKNLFGYKTLRNYPMHETYPTGNKVSLKLKPNTNYTLSSNVPTTSNYPLYFGGVLAVDIVYLNLSKTRTTDAEGNLWFLVFSDRQYGAGLFDGTYYIQLEEGNTATAYEEYKPPAPSPDYPIAINSLDKSFDIVSSVGGINLLPNTKTMGSGIIIGGAKNGEYQGLTIAKSVKTSSSYQDTISTKTIGIPTETTYTISFFAKANMNTSINNHFYSPNTTTSALTSQGNTSVAPDGSSSISLTTEWKRYWITWTQTVPTTVKNIIVGRNNGAIGTEVEIAGVKFEAGSVATPYSEAPEDIQYNIQSPTLYKTNILLSEPLRSVGDVKDRLFLDTDGLWKVERNVGEKLFNGTESGSPLKNDTQVATNYLYYFNPTTTAKFPNIKYSSTNISCSHLAFVPDVNSMNSSNQSLNNKTGVSPNYGVIYINVGLTLKDNTVAGITKWLNDNNVIFNYELETPTIETLSAEQQTKLNNIQSFKGSNYVYTMAGVVPNLNAKFKSNMWYRMNVLGEKQVSGNRNWVSNGNLAYPLEKSLWSSYYKGTVKETVDISTETPPFKNALHIKQTTSGVAGIIDAVIWEGASANVLAGQNVSMATWLKYQNVATSELTMNVQVTGKKSDGTFVYETYKAFSYTGTDATWKRLTGTVKLALPAGAIEITRIVFRLGLAGSGTGEFWATGIQLETGNSIGDWTSNPDDTKDELNKTEARLLLTEKEVGLSVKKGELINGVFVNGDGTRIKGENLEIDANAKFNRDLIMNAGVIRSADGGTTMDLNTNTFNFSKPITFNYKPVATTEDVGLAVGAVEVGVKNYFTKNHAIVATVAPNSFTPRSPETPNGFKVTGAQSGAGNIRINNVITENGWWTVSFDIKGTQSTSVGLYVDICDLGQTRVISNALNTYTRVSVSVNVTNFSTLYNFIDFSGIGWVYYLIDNIKVEKGNKATDYTRAPEDEQEDLSNFLDGKADQLAFEEALEDLALAKSLAEDALNSGTYANFIAGYDSYKEAMEIDKGVAEGALNAVRDTVVAIENNLGESAEQWNFIQTSITNSEQGILITNEGSPMGVMISNDRISFYDNGVEVAFISDKVLQINHGIFVQSAQIGAHLISSLPENPDITIVQWVGFGI